MYVSKTRVDDNHELLDRLGELLRQGSGALLIESVNTGRSDIYVAVREILHSAKAYPRDDTPDRLLLAAFDTRRHEDGVVAELNTDAAPRIRSIHSEAMSPEDKAFALLRSHEGDFITDFTFNPGTDDEGEADDARAALTIKAERELGLILEHSRWEDGVWHLTFERDEEEAARRAAEAVGGIQERERRAQDLLKRLRGDE